jgi:predicted flap endonuclease-1-like 5' DNA nuclease
MILFSLCDLPFWLLWLLPLLLGMLAAWLWWRSKYQDMVTDFEGQISALNSKISGLETNLSDCTHKRSELEGELAITKGRMRELEAGNAKISGTTTKKTETKKASSAGSGELAAMASGFAAGKASSSSGKKSTKASAFAAIQADNLQIIEGIGPKMESVLKENEVDSHQALAAKSPEELRAMLNKYGDRYRIIDPKTWQEQAKLAAIGDWDNLIVLQKNLDTGRDTNINQTDSKLEKYLIRKGLLKAYKQDDLTAIEGIGPATAKLFKENGIETWRALAESSVDDLKSILDAAGKRFSLSDPTTWPKQAEMAADGKFDELREYQDFLNGGRE